MKKIMLNRGEYADRVYGCWIGKNIGGTLGGPFEGRREILDVSGYTTPAGEPLPNDDLDLQLVWLKAVIERGVQNITAQLLGEYWIDYIPPPWGEYGVAKMNLRSGLLPPVSGTYVNDILKNSNGAWIRSEIWACLFPGAPDAAIRLAYEDASVDHGVSEGMYAELFTAAVESAAFVIGGVRELIRVGLSRIPAESLVARAVRIAEESYDGGLSWQEARARVVNDSVPAIGWFQAPANVGFVIIGWLYGEGDFGKSLLIATNCGDDTDCTAATLGAILGIMRGAKRLPAEWTAPLGDRIATIAIDRGKAKAFWPTTLAALTEMTVRQAAPALVAFDVPVELHEGKTDLSALSGMDLCSASAAAEICARPPYAVRIDAVHSIVTLDYQRAPELKTGEPFTVRLYIRSVAMDYCRYEIIWRLPPGIRVAEGSETCISLLRHDIEKNLMNRGAGKVREPLTFTLIPESLAGGTIRGILEVRAPGRPNVGFIPLVFFQGAN